MCWLHMELCKSLFSTPEKLTKTKMFGIYVHSLTAHSATQLELACLRSLNTESQERLFGQGRLNAEACTNHHPDNVIPQVMLRLQAKQEQREIISSVKNGDSQVSHVAKDMPQQPATRVKNRTEKTIGRYTSKESVHSLFLFGGLIHPMVLFSMMGTQTLPTPVMTSH